MTVMAQMKATVDKNTNTQEYLGKLYNQIKGKILLENIVTKEDEKAQKLESFLRFIKSVQNNNGIVDQNSAFSKFWSIQEQLSIVEELKSISGTIFSENLFNIKGNNIQERGDALERGIAQIVKGFSVLHETGDKKAKYNQVISKTGTMHTQVPDLLDYSNEIMKDTFNKFYQKTAQEMNASKNKKNYGNTTMHSVFGKIDNTGLSADLEIRTVTQLEADIVDCLRNATFTAKNYISDMDIHLGQTNPFRVYMTLGSGNEHYNRWHRMINCFQGHSTGYHNEAPNYFYRLRGIYELTGFGMQYTAKANQLIAQQLSALGYAKYLIWNTPGSSDIRVIPTSRIISAIIDNTDSAFQLPDNWKDAMYGPISLSQKSIKFD